MIKFINKVSTVVLLLINTFFMWIGGLIIGFMFAIKNLGFLYNITPFVMFMLLAMNLTIMYRVLNANK